MLCANHLKRLFVPSRQKRKKRNSNGDSVFQNGRKKRSENDTASIPKWQTDIWTSVRSLFFRCRSHIISKKLMHAPLAVPFLITCLQLLSACHLNSQQLTHFNFAVPEIAHYNDWLCEKTHFLPPIGCAPVCRLRGRKLTRTSQRSRMVENNLMSNFDEQKQCLCTYVRLWNRQLLVFCFDWFLIFSQAYS